MWESGDDGDDDEDDEDDEDDDEPTFCTMLLRSVPRMRLTLAKA